MRKNENPLMLSTLLLLQDKKYWGCYNIQTLFEIFSKIFQNPKKVSETFP